MPYAVLVVKNPEFLSMASYAAEELPEAIAQALSLGDRELHEGKITSSEVMIVPLLSPAAVNGKDFELIIFAHNFPERMANVEERKEMILEAAERLWRPNMYEVSVAVCLMLVPMAYGEFKLS